MMINPEAILAAAQHLKVASDAMRKMAGEAEAMGRAPLKEAMNREHALLEEARTGLLREARQPTSQPQEKVYLFTRSMAEALTRGERVDLGGGLALTLDAVSFGVTLPGAPAA